MFVSASKVDALILYHKYASPLNVHCSNQLSLINDCDEYMVSLTLSTLYLFLSVIMQQVKSFMQTKFSMHGQFHIIIIIIISTWLLMRDGIYIVKRILTVQPVIQLVIYAFCSCSELQPVTVQVQGRHKTSTTCTDYQQATKCQFYCISKDHSSISYW